MRSLGRTSATWKRYSTGRSFRQRATRLAAFAALILAAATGIAAAIVLLELRMPARLGSALSGAELDDAAVADLCVYIQKCSHLGAPDLPAQRVQSLVARKASRALDAEAPAASTISISATEAVSKQEPSEASRESTSGAGFALTA